jgi:rubrerythrin
VSVAERLEGARRREKEQTLFYRALAAAAEDAGRVPEAERFNDLHADEQHHLSRLTARVLELGGRPEDLRRLATPAVPSLAAWEPAARAREDDEVRFYEALLTGDLDASTRAVLDEILEAERRHREHLGGKWMSA